MRTGLIIVIVVLIGAIFRFGGLRAITGRRSTTSDSFQGKKPLKPWQKKFFTVFVFAKINSRRYFRDRVAIFWTIAFPLIFLFVFGGIFGKNSSVSFKVAVINESNTQFSRTFVKSLNNSKLFKVSQNVTTLSNADNEMAHGELDASIILPPGFGQMKSGQSYASGQAVVYYTENEAESAQALESVLQGEFQGINAKLVKESSPLTVTSKESNTLGLTQFDYTFSGLLGFSILGLGIFGPANVFPELKKQGILRRFHTTPIKVWQFFMSNMISQAFIGLVTMVVMFIVAIVVFHLKVVGNYFELAVFLAMSIVMVLGIGLALGGWAKNERQSAPLANVIVFPMMFLSGTFFPRYLMPQWLQNISSFLPLTPVIDGARLIATEGKSLIAIGPQIGMIALWAVIIYAVAFRVFRWE